MSSGTAKIDQQRASVELFAGAGGLGIGLAQAGFLPKAVFEYDRWCCDTLRANHIFSEREPRR